MILLAARSPTWRSARASAATCVSTRSRAACRCAVSASPCARPRSTTCRGSEAAGRDAVEGGGPERRRRAALGRRRSRPHALRK